MMHLNDDQIMLLAEHTNDMVPYSEEEMELLEHLKSCGACFDQFCTALVLTEAVSPAGFLGARSAFHYAAAAEAEPHVARKILAVVQFVRNTMDLASRMAAQQLEQLGDLLTFTPALALGARGSSAAEERLVRLDEIEDENTSIVFDSVSRQLLVQINSGILPEGSLCGTVQMEDGLTLDIPFTLQGKQYRGLVPEIPDGNFHVELYVSQ